MSLSENIPWLNAIIFAIGSFTLLKPLLRFSGVLLQTFVLPGNSVRYPYVILHNPFTDSSHSWKSMEPVKVFGQVCVTPTFSTSNIPSNSWACTSHNWSDWWDRERVRLTAGNGWFQHTSDQQERGKAKECREWNRSVFFFLNLKDVPLTSCVIENRVLSQGPNENPRNRLYPPNRDTIFGSLQGSRVHQNRCPRYVGMTLFLINHSKYTLPLSLSE